MGRLFELKYQSLLDSADAFFLYMYENVISEEVFFHKFIDSTTMISMPQATDIIPV
jgi:hypothetical protein